MKICYVTARTPFGLAEAFILTEIVEVKLQGINILVVPRSTDCEVFHEDAKQIQKYSLRLPLISLNITAHFLVSFATKLRTWKILAEILVKSGKFSSLVKNLAVLPKGIFIASMIKKNDINHIHAHWGTTPSTMAYVASQMSDIPWSLTLHRWDIKENNLLETKIKSAVFARCISEHGKKELEVLLGNKCRSKIKLLHAGVKIPNFVNKPKCRNIFSIVTPAHFYDVKGHQYLIEACQILVKKNIHNFHCTFFGEGPLMQDLKKIVSEKKLECHVTIKNTIEHEKLLKMYKDGSVDAVILPSINTDKGEHEGIPVALMEAMAYKIPVIATNTGGISELLSGNAGRIVKEKNPEDLAMAIENFMSNDFLYNQYKENGYNKVEEQFNVCKNVKALLNFMQEAVH